MSTIIIYKLSQYRGHNNKQFWMSSNQQCQALKAKSTKVLTSH